MGRFSVGGAEGEAAAEAEVGFETEGNAPVGPFGPDTDHRKLVAPMLPLPSRAIPLANGGAPLNVRATGLAPPLITGFAATPPGCMPARTQL